MAKISPIGTTVAEHRRRRARRSAAYRAEERRLAQFEKLARLVIKHRAALGLSQQELAERMGTSHSAISRIESGRHKTSVETLQRVAEALDPSVGPGLRERPSRPTGPRAGRRLAWACQLASP
jgi:ribosome-binding protein aMBF1 (putative translation factor)